MKIIELYKLTRTVQYFGLTLIVPVDTKYIATDASAKIYAYECKPLLTSHKWVHIPHSRYDEICLVDLQEIYWRGTLQEVLW